MAFDPGKPTRDLAWEPIGYANRPEEPDEGGTRLLKPQRTERAASGNQDQGPEPGAEPPPFVPELDMLTSDLKSEQLVSQWIDKVLGEEAPVTPPAPPVPMFYAPAPSAATRSVDALPVPVGRAARSSPGRRAAVLCLGGTGLLVIAFLAVPSPYSLQKLLVEKTDPSSSPSAKSVIAPLPVVSITVLAPRGQGAWLNKEITRFNKKNVGGFRAARLTANGGSDGVSAVLDGQARPTVFGSSRPGDMARLNEGWLLRQHGTLVANIDDPRAFRRVSKMPLVVLDAPWVNLHQHSGGIAFLDFLAKDRRKH